MNTGIVWILMMKDELYAPKSDNNIKKEGNQVSRIE